jgi:hypothetical protein
MAKNIKNNSSKAASTRKAGLKPPIKVTKVAAAKLGVGFRLAGNHNETIVR